MIKVRKIKGGIRIIKLDPRSLIMKNKNSHFKFKLKVKSILEPVFSKLGFVLKNLITFSDLTENKGGLLNKYF